MKEQNKESRTQNTVYKTVLMHAASNPLLEGRRRRGLRNLILVLSLALMTTACDKKPVDPTATISFFGTNLGSNSVYMTQNNALSNGETLVIDVKVSNISSNVYGAAFDIDFDSTKMTSNGYSTGSFLEQGGNAVNYQVGLQPGNSGKLLVGVSRMGSVSGATGSGTLVTLKFNVSGGGSVAFSNSGLKDANGGVIPGVSWSGGTVTVR